VRVVMSRTLKLPEDANLWDVGVAPTVVMTQRGAREDFQARLRAKGCEVVQFDFLTPRAVMDYCFHRGFLQVRHHTHMQARVHTHSSEMYW